MRLLLLLLILTDLSYPHDCMFYSSTSHRFLGHHKSSIIVLIKWPSGCAMRRSRCDTAPFYSTQHLISASLIFIAVISHQMNTSDAVHENLCLEDDYTNDLPIFIEKQTICNFEAVPVQVYTIKTTPDNKDNKYCLRGESAEKFNINKDNEIKLFERLAQTETNLRIQIIRTSDEIIGTPTERRKAVNAIQFILIIEDCNQVNWQTIVVAALSSVCMALVSTLAIMLILYQQKGLIRSSANDDDRPLEERNPQLASNVRDESFINPRRTSSYEFSTMSRQSASTLERQETDNV